MIETSEKLSGGEGGRNLLNEFVKKNVCINFTRCTTWKNQNQPPLIHRFPKSHQPSAQTCFHTSIKNWESQIEQYIID